MRTHAILGRESRAEDWVVVAASVLAGALAAPPGVASTPVSAAVAVIVCVVGLRVWRWSGLHRGVRGEKRGGIARVVRPVSWAAFGLVLGLCTLGVIRFAIEPALPAIGERIAEAAESPAWRRGVVVYVAAVGEEVLFRLLALSAVAGVLARVAGGASRATGGTATPSRRVVWASIAASALAFGVSHLPAWSGSAPPSLALSSSVVALNAAGGVAFGYAFATRGVAAAMMAHGGADCAIQFLGPFVS